MFQGFVRERLSHTRELHDKFAFAYALVPLAAAAILKGDHAWAARILGAGDPVTERMSVTIVDRSVDDLENGTNERRALVDGETGGAKPPV
jgi:hypothetical protein